MKKAINAWSVDSKIGFEDMFRQVKAAGFDGIELNVDAEGHSSHSFTLATTAEELAEVKAISEKYDLPVVSISTSLWWSANMGCTKPESREVANKLLKQQLTCAKTLGASGILVVPGGINEDCSIAQAYKNSFDFLESSKALIEEYKIYVGLENVWNTFFLSPFDMANFVDGLDCEYISAYYDVGNVVAFSWSEYWVDILDSRISHVHIKDFKRNSGTNSGGSWPDLLKGDTNFAKIMPALRKAGFDGYLTAEVFKADDNLSFEAYYKEVADAAAQIIAM